MDTDDSKRAQCNRYRAIADALRVVVRNMKHAEAAEELRLLAVSYERLAEHAEGAKDAPQDVEGPVP